MTSSPAPSLPPSDGPDAAWAASLLRQALALDAAGAGVGEEGGGEPGEEAGRLEALRNAPDEATRARLEAGSLALLADLGAALVAAEERSVLPSRAVKAAAVAAYDRLAAAEQAAAPAPATTRVPAGPGGRLRDVAEGRARIPGRPGWRPWAAAAALLAGLGAVFGLRGGDAEAGMRISALYRVDLARGATSFEPARTVGFGEVLEAGPETLLAVGFSGSSKVVLTAGDAARVVRGPDGAGMLALEHGTAFLTADGEPTRLSVGGHGILVVERGVARVETIDGLPDVAVAAGATARFLRSDGAGLPIAGPTRVRVERTGLAPLGPPEASLFRDLAFFGGAPRRHATDPWVPSRLWRIASGRAARLEGRLSWDAASSVRLAWRPDPAVASSRALRLSLRGPAGLTVAVEGFPEARGVLPAETAAVEPGLPTIEIPLPDGWFADLGDREMVILVAPPPTPPGAPIAPAGPSGRARFDGAALAWDDDA